MLDSWNVDGFFHKIGLEGVQYGEITTAIYLKVSVSDFLTLFSARTGPKFFWQIKPAMILLIGGCLALFISSILSLFWPTSTLDGVDIIGLQENPGLFGFVWIFCILFWFVQDAFKVAAYHWMFKTNFNNISTTGVVVLPDSAVKLREEMDAVLADGGNHGGH
jgi:H+-transporting ATPase